MNPLRQAMIEMFEKMKREHFTGEMLYGPVHPDIKKRYLEGDETARLLVESTGRPEVCYCETPEDHK